MNIELTMVEKEFEETPPLRIPCDDLDLRAFLSGGSGGAVKFTVPIRWSNRSRTAPQFH